MTQFNDFQLVKRRFFAMRNGIIADTMRRAGAPYKIVFGLNLQQIKEIAAQFGVRPDLASRLWADVRTRESVLIAPYMLDLDALTPADALAMVASAPTPEAVDILAIAALRRVAWSGDLLARLADTAADSGAAPVMVYAALRLAMNLATPAALERAEPLARVAAEAAGVGGDQLWTGALRAVGRQVLAELAFLREEV